MLEQKQAALIVPDLGVRSMGEWILACALNVLVRRTPPAVEPKL